MRRTLAALVLACWAGSALAGPVARPFPDGFLWGTAISGFQSDMGQGAPVDAGSDWWAWVRDPQNLAQHRVSGDLPEDGGPGFWLRYASDARLARRGLRANAFRMGIEWSRIFPTSTAGVDASGGVTPAVLAQLDALADQSAVAHYRDVFAALRARGLEPLVTLNHFSLPTWIHDPVAVRDAFTGVNPFTGSVPPGLPQAGWLDAGIVDEFAKLAAYAGWKFGDQVDLWATLNEPVVVIVSGFVNAPGLGGNFPPGVFSLPSILTLMPNLVEAHARGYDAVHATDATDADGDGTAAAVGAVHNMVALDPKDPQSANDQAGAAHADYLFNRVFPVAITQGRFDANLDGDTDDPGEDRPDLARSDFLGVNYYLRATATGIGAAFSPSLPLFDFVPTQSYAAGQCPSVCTEFGWEIHPEGLRRVLTFAGTLGVPLYITENGLADADDDQRADYLARHLAVVQDVVADGVADVRGYFEWSLTDNFEWASGYQPRFGAYGIDAATGKRLHRPSSRVFRTVARKNGIPSSLVRRFGL